jgi:hypothetical protein
MPHLYNFTDSGWIYDVPYHALATSLATYVFMLNTGTSCRDWPCQLADTPETKSPLLVIAGVARFGTAG